MNRLEGKRAIVTGGATGIGRACAERFVREGAEVAIFDVREQAGRDLAAELTRRGLKASFWRVDVARESEVSAAIAEVAKAFGGLEILVNNAGIAQPFKKTEDVSEEEWDRLMSINLKGVFFNTKHAIPHLRAAGGASIVNVSSVCALVSFGGLAPYHAAKGGVRMMTKNDAMDLARDKIRVNSVMPGWVWTGMTQEELALMGKDFEVAKSEAAQSVPWGRMGEPQEIASAVLFLASDEASYVTGSEIVVDGGYTAR